MTRHAHRLASLGLLALACLAGCGDETPRVAGTAAPGPSPQADALPASAAGTARTLTARARADATVRAPGRVRAMPDFDGDGLSDLLWSGYSDDSPAYLIWRLKGQEVLDTARMAAGVPDARRWRIVAYGDFNGDGKTDLIVDTGARYEPPVREIWLMDGSMVRERQPLPALNGWFNGRVRAVLDMDGDGRDDIVIERGDDSLCRIDGHPTGGGWFCSGLGLLKTEVLLMDGSASPRVVPLLDQKDEPDQVLGFADFDGDGLPELLLERQPKLYKGLRRPQDFERDHPDHLLILRSSPFAKQARPAIQLPIPPGAHVLAPADLNGDGRADLIIEDLAVHNFQAWVTTGWGQFERRALIDDPMGAWELSLTADLDGDGKQDLIWYDHIEGTTSAWLMDGVWVKNTTQLLGKSPYRPVQVMSTGAHGQTLLMWRRDDIGRTVAWGLEGMERRWARELVTDPKSLVVPVGALGAFQGFNPAVR